MTKYALPFLIASTLVLSACSDARERLGLVRSAPDEFKVVKNAPLEMPPSLQLPAPRPGAPRPQELAVAEQAKEVLLGEKTNQSAPISTAESALLQEAGADQSQEDIRFLIDSEEGLVDESSQSVAKRLLGIGGDREEGDSVLNAEEEAERLKNLQNAQ